MTFSISGIASLNAWNSGGSGSTTCGLDYNNTGLDTQATSVNFGSLSNGGFSKAAQKITISTNGSYGYSLTATSPGHFISLTTGYWLPDANGGNGLSGGNDLPAPLYLGLASSIATINATNSTYLASVLAAVMYQPASGEHKEQMLTIQSFPIHGTPAPMVFRHSG